MATFSTWAALRDDIKNAIATYVAGSPLTKSYTHGSHSWTCHSIDDLTKLYTLTYTLEGLDNAGTHSSITSYGRYRRPV